MAHLDGNGTDEAVSTMVSRVQELALGYPEGRIELQLIGGFRDQQGYGEDLFSNIMRKFHYSLKKSLVSQKIISPSSIAAKK